VWEEPSEYRRASWNRRIPEGTVAVIHTHPADSPEPSSHDFAEAARLDAPVIVVCRGKLTMALPGKNSARDRNVSNVYTSDPDEASTVSQSQPRQTSSLSDEGPRAHP
jgi:proteasome lid subunit RPN8/RPN11